MNAKVVVITGCSRGGIGWALCEEWNRRGHRVFAASRSLVKMQGLSQGITPVELDINSEASVKAGVAKIIRQAGKIAPLIEVDPTELRKTFDVNVFGLLTMIQAVAPHMVEQRSGTIVNIGSIVAYVPTPWAGVYRASKAAARAQSQRHTQNGTQGSVHRKLPFSASESVKEFDIVTHLELSGFGIKLVCVAPGAIKSAIGASNDKRAVLSPASVYSNVEAFVRSRGTWSQNPMSTTAAELASSIVDAALSMSPPRYLSYGYRVTDCLPLTISTKIRILIPFYHHIRVSRPLAVHFCEAVVLPPTSLKEYFWGTRFGIDEVGASRESHV